MTDLPEDARKTRISLARRLLMAAGAGMISLAVLGTACSWLPVAPWFLEGAAYWVPVYLALGLAGTLVCLVVGRRAWALAGGACVCAVAGLMIPCYLTSPNAAPPGTAPNLRILQANVYEHRGSAAALMELIGRERPDVVLLQEADEEWERRLLPLESDYPHKAFLPRSARGKPDLGLYWRGNLDEPRALAAQGIPAVLLEMQVNGRAVALLNVHPSAPFLPGRARHHREQMTALAEFVRGLKTLPILAGDLNSSPWSQQCRALQQSTGLVSVRQGRGILGTWPSFFGPLRVGIDQVLVSPEIQVVGCRVGSGIGSDHRPLITEFRIAAPGAADGAGQWLTGQR